MTAGLAVSRRPRGRREVRGSAPRVRARRPGRAVRGPRPPARTGATNHSAPVRVDYRLTPLGEDLMPLLEAIKNWAEIHMEDVEAAREAYDRRPAAAP
ncbi:helix-turn-helix transcriptional regulator [Microbispora cellulosiformans]|uniref:Helix-turn-helix transcriptional regulator n=1 Tax=Microbispora cellulosiformans TaxID=2614688 RepID=A0A5J5JSU6_9ACTN|nr:winged helix-turn-helix transcriptional regulator [Microbispora cellulosiformans]KAA9373096.1 helix-turn-helix transcriptional regulator [Microbispora cellulosiformans]